MKRGPVVRFAALAFVVILIVALLVGCAKFDGNKAEFCRLLPKAPSFQSLMFTTSVGTDKQAAQKMRDAARDFRSLEQSAPRSIRATVAALGDSAERIGRRLADPSTQRTHFLEYRIDAQGKQVPVERSASASRVRVFYSEFSAHPGTASAAIALLTYAQKDCGIQNLNSTLGLNGYGSYQSYSPFGNVINGRDTPAPMPSNGSHNGVTVIPPASTPLPPPSTSVPETSTTSRAGATTNRK